MSTLKRQIVFPKEWLVARFTARFSLFAPLAAFVLWMFLKFSRWDEAEFGWQRFACITLGILALCLPWIGFLSGIVGLVAVRRYGRIRYGRGTSCIAIAGIVICGLYILLLVFVLFAIWLFPPH